MTSLTRYNFPYRGGYAYYSGTGSSVNVPYIFPIAINGRPYMIDTKSPNFTRQFDARARDTVDQSNEPGEAALYPQGLWRRSQSSWHYGAGQTYSDTADAEPYRFNTSKGVDVWTKGRLSLLNDTVLAYSSTNTNLDMVTADGRLYIIDGQALKYSTNLSSFTSVTGTPAYTAIGHASDGYNVYVSYADNNIYKTDASSSAASAYVTNIVAGTMQYVKGRLMVAGTGASKNKIWNITTNGNNPTALFEHPNANFAWVAFAAGQNYIYAAGYAGNKSYIYKTIIKADGSSLDAPTVAADLPLGEVVQYIHGYLGYICIGLDDGFRLASSDGDGNLVVGPKIVINSPVSTFAGIGKYIYFGWKNFDSTSTGIGRMDISAQITTNQAAYASDLMATAQGAIVDIHEYQDSPVFSVAGVGVFKKDTALVSSGYLTTGTFRWGIPDAKFVPMWDIRTEPLSGTISLAVSQDSGFYVTIGTQSTSGSLESTFDGLEAKMFETQAKLTFTRDATSTSLGPVMTRWMGRAYAAPLRSELFSVPILLHHKINIRGKEYWFDVDDELVRLRDLVTNPRVITYQENLYTYSVIVEDVRWDPVDSAFNHAEWDWNGTATVIMRSVR